MIFSRYLTIGVRVPDLYHRMSLGESLESLGPTRHGNWMALPAMATMLDTVDRIDRGSGYDRIIEIVKIYS